MLQSQSPSDPQSPFSFLQRSFILTVVCFAGLLSPLSSLMYTPALPAIAQSLGVSISDVNLTVTTYLIFQGITPSIWGSISDVYGRRPIYLVTLFITVCASIGLCFTNSFAVVLVLRAVHATGCSSTRALGAGVIRDMVSAEIRGGYMGMYSAGVGVGTAFGPFLGGLLAQYTTWHGIFYFILALSVISFVSVLLLLPETLQPSAGTDTVTLHRFCPPPIPLFGTSKRDNRPRTPPLSRPKLDFLRPLRIMRYPDVLCALVFTGICYTVWQDSMVATSAVYTYNYGLSEAQIGLTYIANGVGALIGSLVIGRILDWDYRRQMKVEHPGTKSALTIEHARMRSLAYHAPLFTLCMLAFGWIVQSHVHIAVSVIFSFCIGWLDSSILDTYSTLMVDLFEDAASASSASINLVRCLLGAVGSSTIALMINAMGVGWSFTTLSGILVLSAPLVWFQYRFGSKYRAERFVQGRLVYHRRIFEERKDSSGTSVESPSSYSSISQPFSSSSTAPPAAFPVDFEAYGDEKKSYGYVDVDICDAAVIKRLSQVYASASTVTLSHIITSAFCTVLFRVTGQGDGEISVLNAMDAPLPLSYTINPDLIPLDLIQAVSSTLSTTSTEKPLRTFTQCLLLLSFSSPTEQCQYTGDSDPISEWQLSHNGSRGLHARIHFAQNVYDAASIRLYAGILSRVLVAFASYPSAIIGTLPICSAADLGDIIRWNDTSKPDLEFSSIGDMFRRQARAIPDLVAVENGDQSLSLTYRQLDQWSDALAGWLLLQTYNDKREIIIGVFQTRSAMLVVTYLACLKAGYAYMPIEMSLPPERIRGMLTASRSPLVLGYGPHQFPCDDAVRYVNLATLDMQHLHETIPASAISALPSVPPDRLSSVVFTSGSTGVPKVIMIQHSCLRNLLLSDYKPIHQGDRTAMMLSIAFDVSSGEIWYPLARGATIVVYMQEPGSPFDVDNLSSFLENNGINQMNAPVAIMKALVEAKFFERPLPSLRSLAMGGEPLFLAFLHPIMLAKPNLILSNNYGPSESTVDATFFTIPPGYNRANVVIGNPMANIGAYVVDEYLNPVPRGVCGELLLTGKSLARGYLNREELTAQSFIQLGHQHCLGPLRAYRTGDLVRQTASGELEFVRRANTGQVKLRGHRIELGEVERAIEQHPLVSSVVVVVCRFEEGDERLVAYVTSRACREEDEIADIVKTHLRALLPSYMVPSMVLSVSSFPFSTTGKLDRRLMASPHFVDQVSKSRPSFKPKHQSSTATMTPDEAAVVGIFSRVLGVPQTSIGLHDNLFDIGGHSLIATRIVAAIRRHFGVSFGVALFYDNATPAGVLANLAQCEFDAEASLVRSADVDAQELCPASDAQTRLWVEEQINPGLSRYHAGFQRRLTGPLNADALQKAFFALLDRHETLRTVFEMHDPVLMQRVKPLQECSPVRFVDLQIPSTEQQLEEAEKHAQNLLAEEYARPFNLIEDIPARFVIIKVTSDLHFVSAIIHHIATDGWSTGIIDQDVTLFYNSFSVGINPKLDPLPLRYRDYAIWQQQKVRASLKEKQLVYWSNHLHGAKPLELRTDYIRPQKLSDHAAEIPISIDRTSVLALREMAAKHRTSLYVVLLAAYRTALFRVNGEDDGAIGIVNANRTRPELEGIVGFFVNTHAIRLPINSDTTFESMIVETRKAMTAALENADVPFDKVVAHLAPVRDLSRNALVQILFAPQDFSGISQNRFEGGLQGLTAEEIRTASARVDLSLHLTVEDEALHGHFMYLTDLFTSSSIQTFSNVFQSVVTAVIHHPFVSLSKLPLSNFEDLERLFIWNDTQKQSPGLQRSIGDRFREVATRCGSSIAVVDGPTILTYAMLDDQSERLASWLVSRDIHAESVVGVHMRRSALLVVAYLGCLKAGVAYLPLDKSLPEHRIRLMVGESACPLVLTSGDFPLEGEVSSLDLTENTDILFSWPISSLPPVSSQALSNVIFTSGSTGVPKGVMVEHHGMVNLCAPETTNWVGDMKNGFTTSIGFDPSGFQIFTTLLGGSELYCLPDHGTFDVEELQHFIVESGIQRISTTPSILAALLDVQGDWLERSSLRQIMLGGEKLAPSRIAECIRRRPQLEVASSYGPAEASVRSAYHVVDASTANDQLCRVPIGRALTNTRIYVVDEDFSPVPPGVLGEIIISGTHLARGYLNQPALTAERFLNLSQDSPLGSQRIYRTGDLGFWTADGLVQFVGRMDSQLKIRGQRLEAGEVESTLKRHPAVDEAAVVVVSTTQDERLVAYVHLSEDEEVTKDVALGLWEDRYNIENMYGELDDDVAGHDWARWVSMYTGEQIPAEEMQEWLDDTIRQLEVTSTDRVLELGVGTGKIALNIIDQVSSFVGTDISSVCVKFMQTQIEHRRLASKLSVFQGAAHEFDLLQKSNPSLVIINSVAQYFPSPDYFDQVVTNIIGVMPRGRIFIGDVRSFALIPYHDLERALATLDADSTMDDICLTLQRYAEAQSEFLLSPSYFFKLQSRFPQITHVEIKPKSMFFRNELSRYRYTAVLYVGSRPTVIEPSTWIDCSSADCPVSVLRSQLHASAETALGALNIPVSDIEHIHSLYDYIHSFADSPQTLSTLRQKLAGSWSKVESTPASLIQMAKEEGWNVVLDASLQGRSGAYLRAIFTRGKDCSSGIVGGFPRLELSAGPSHNTLSVGEKDVSAVLGSIDKHLRKSLPSYMVPSQIVPVNELPLNRSGKLDRKLLSSREYLESHDVVAQSQYIGAITDTERQVLAIFARALNRHPDTIDITESLFNLGGHSLMATLVVAAVRREMKSNLSIASFFRAPTVKDIAALLSQEHPPSSSPQSKAELVGANTTIVVNEEFIGPALFMFPETTGFASVYSSAFEHTSNKIIAFGDENWGRSPASGDTIPSVVSTLIPHIRQVQPHGPYFLSGWSLGGYMALEAAQQLEAAGESVNLVMMFDSSVYTGPLGDAQWSRGLDPLLTMVDDKDSWLAQFTRANRMISGYEVSKISYGGRVVLVKALRGRDPDEVNPPPSDPLNGWGAILPQVEVLHIDSSHRAMFDRVNGPVIGAIIERILSGYR